MQKTTIVTSLVAAGIGALVFYVGALSVGALITGPFTTYDYDCRGHDCDIEIFVKCTNNICTPYVEKDRVWVDRIHKLTFTIITANFSFASDGIKFTDTTDIPCTPGGNAQKFQCKVSTPPSTPTEHKYQIHVLGAKIVDPTIIVY